MRTGAPPLKATTQMTKMSKSWMTTTKTGALMKMVRIIWRKESDLFCSKIYMMQNQYHLDNLFHLDLTSFPSILQLSSFFLSENVDALSF